MKKVIALLSLTAFMAVSVIAQTSQSSAPVSKKEAPVTSIKAESKKAESKVAAGKSCCMKANVSCCKNNKDSKNCTAEQKAACAKAGKECSSHASVVKETKAAEIKGEKVPVVKAQTLDANEIQ